MNNDNFIYYLEASFINYYGETDVVIYKRKDTSKFYFFDSGLEGSPWKGDTLEFTTLEEAVIFFFNYKPINFFKFQISLIDSSLINYYTKNLIEYLNSEEYGNFSEELPLDNFNEYLGVEIKLIVDAKNKGFKIINITKNNKKYFFVGSLILDNSSIIIKNENDDIIFLTSNDSLTLETVAIKNKYYWYFSN